MMCHYSLSSLLYLISFLISPFFYLHIFLYLFIYFFIFPKINEENEGMDEYALKVCRDIWMISLQNFCNFYKQFIGSICIGCIIYIFFAVGTMDVWTEHKVKNGYGYLENLEAIWCESLTADLDPTSCPTLDGLEYRILSRLYIMLNLRSIW